MDPSPNSFDNPELDLNNIDNLFGFELPEGVSAILESAIRGSDIYRLIVTSHNREYNFMNRGKLGLQQHLESNGVQINVVSWDDAWIDN